LKKSPKCQEILYNLAFSYKNNGEFIKAEFYFNKILEIDNKHIDTYLNLGEILCKTKSYELGLKRFEKAVEIDKKYSNSNSLLLFYLNYAPNHSPEEIFSYYKNYGYNFTYPFKKNCQSLPLIKEQKSKLKIGYVSPDFKKHSMRGFLEPVLSNHNHDQFEIYAFAELSEEDHITQQYKSYVDHWIPTQALSDQEMVQKIRELQIDILVDLAGHTEGNRLEIFARKPAPISISYWIGYGYTTGLNAIDYFLANETIVPKGSDNFFSEKIWRMNKNFTNPWQPNLISGDVGPLPALDKGHITFGTLTRAIRINDRVIKAWSQILKRVKHSKLVINSADFSHYKTKRMIISKFEEYGIKQNRLEVGYQSPPWDTMRQIDIALDCFPHNSGTTLIEHLYMGNPFVTYSNRPSVGKIGASILTALGREEWIAYSEQEYIDKAVALATDTKKLASIRSSLREEMKRSPIMDHKGFVRELERTYQSMWENYLKKVS
jgi:predicted O-linked N-acetylglucosamine transferase (SPINDLY family)